MSTNVKTCQKHWHFWIWLQRKLWTNIKNTNNDKHIYIFEYDSSDNNEHLLKQTQHVKQRQNMTKALTFLNMIAAKIMKIYNKLTNMTKKYKTWQKHWHFWIWLQRKLWKFYSELTCHIYEYFWIDMAAHFASWKSSGHNYNLL